MSHAFRDPHSKNHPFFPIPSPRFRIRLLPFSRVRRLDRDISA